MAVMFGSASVRIRPSRSSARKALVIWVLPEENLFVTPELPKVLAVGPWL